MANPPIYIVSGGNGASGELLVRTALAQFEDVDPPLVVEAHVRGRKKLEEVVASVCNAGGVIVHTMVDAELRKVLIGLAQDNDVPAIDSIGPVLDQLAELLGQVPLGRPGQYRKLREDYFKRIEAIDFAVHHDDGMNQHELHLADVVLTGVSRSSKTPLCMVLAMRGFKAANVPLIKDVPLPPKLFEIDRSRVVGLTLEPDQLLAHRRYRQRHLGVTSSMPYASPTEVHAEIEYARQVFRRGRFATIDITNKPLEESASEVLALVTRSVG